MTLGCTARLGHANSRDTAALISPQTDDSEAIQDRDIRHGTNPPIDPALEKRTAHREKGQITVVPNPPGAGKVPRKITSGIEASGAQGSELVRQSWEQVVGNHSPTRQQGVEVMALRNALPGLGLPARAVPLNNGYLSEVVRENAGGEESGDAAAEYDSVAERAAGRSDRGTCKVAHGLFSTPAMVIWLDLSDCRPLPVVGL
jgi:hypothetical protein